MTATAMTTAIEKPETVTVDGYIEDADTEEILGLAVDAALNRCGIERFEVETIDQAEWVLAKLQHEDAELEVLEIKRRAMNAQIDSMARDHHRRRSFLLGRFEADLRVLAERELAGSKSRTLKTVHGSLSFRKTPGSIKVIDEGLALEWAKANCPEAIRVNESVIVTPLKGRDDLGAGAFAVTEPGESFKIDTGIGGAK